MRKRALSDEGLHLYLNGIVYNPPRHWTRRLVCSLFHSDYDDRLEDVIWRCRNSTQALAAQFNQPNMRERLDAGILHTIRIILTRDNKRVRRRHLLRSFRFFTDVMRRAYYEQDHQTAHMLYLALTHPAIANLNIKPRKKDPEIFEAIKKAYGAPTYYKHIHFWRGVRSDSILPSLIAFKIFITRREFMGRHLEAVEARDMINIFQYLEHNPDEVLPLYSQKRLNNKTLLDLAKKFH
jgi:hypothetical protein